MAIDVVVKSPAFRNYFYRYYYRRCWNVLHSLVPLARIFIDRIRHIVFALAKQPPSRRVHFIENNNCYFVQQIP